MDEPTYDPSDLGTTLHAAITAVLRTPTIKRAIRDILEIYSIGGQSAEVLHNIHDQLVAMAEILTIIYARLILHDRLGAKSSANVSTILTMLQAQSQLYADPSADVSIIISSAVTQLRADTVAMLAAIDDEEAHVKVLLDRARDTAEGIMRTTETLQAGTARNAPAPAAVPVTPPVSPPAVTDAHALRAEATIAAEAATETAAAAAAQTLKAAAAETAAVDAESADAST